MKKQVCDENCFDCPYPDCIKETASSTRALGMCARCYKKPVVPGRTLCQVCREKENARVKKRQARLRAAGLCISCGQTAIPGRPFCQACVEKRRARTRLLEGERKAAGLCPRCGKPADQGRIYCQKCNSRKKKKKEVKPDEICAS